MKKIGLVIGLMMVAFAAFAEPICDRAIESRKRDLAAYQEEFQSTYQMIEHNKKVSVQDAIELLDDVKKSNDHDLILATCVYSEALRRLVIAQEKYAAALICCITVLNNQIETRDCNSADLEIFSKKSVLGEEYEKAGNACDKARRELNLAIATYNIMHN